jgi:hypothetical protein
LFRRSQTLEKLARVRKGETIEQAMAPAAEPAAKPS